MTRTVIWETPENREEYAGTPCENFDGMYRCGMTLADHVSDGRAHKDHDWRIYRDIPTVSVTECDDPGCLLHDHPTAPPTTDAEPALGDTTAPDTADTEGSGSASNLSDAGVEREQAARPRTFEERWPYYCRNCGGWGVHSWNEFVPYGMGSTAMPMSEPCDACAGVGKCGRCGAMQVTPEGEDDAFVGPCGNCHWDFDDGLSEPDWPEEEANP